MRKSILILSLALAATSFCNAQKIETQKVFGGYQYTQNGNQMTMRDLARTVESNQQAFDLMKKAQSTSALASVIAYTGGALIGWPIGTAIGGGDPNWALAGIGAGLVVIGLPISSGANKNAKQAVELYNSSLDTTSFHEVKPEFKIIANGTGIGLSMNF